MPLAREQRKLVAILFADAVGSSRLIGWDESGTVVRLLEHLHGRLAPAAARCSGRVIRLTGDGGMVEFGSAVDALRAAIEFQQAMVDANRDQPEEKAIAFRVGVHLGDVIVEGDDIYGDDVNVAARLEAEAPPGGIVVSRAVREAVEGRLKATLHALGDLALKNIVRPIRAFRVEWSAEDWSSADEVSAPAFWSVGPTEADVPLALPDKPSIAVLPFQNMSGDPDQEYFTDGMVEDIITALSRFKALFVIARNSSFTYKGNAVDIKQVGRELGVRYVLEGSVRKAASKVRVTGQLIDSETGTHIWADRFDGNVANVFDLQDEIATSVVGAIAPKLERAEIERARRKPIENLTAYDCFLRGMAHIHGSVTRESLEQALRLFYRAIELDPAFAAPYGMALRCYDGLRLQGWSVDKDWEKAEVRRLAALVGIFGQDDAVALSWAGYALFQGHEYDAGLTMIDRALSLNPNWSDGWSVRGVVSLFLGDHEAALAQCAHALRLNPLDPDAYLPETIMALAHLLLGRYDEALKLTAKSLGRHPTWTPALRASAVANALSGNIDEARKSMVQLRQVDPSLRISNLNEQIGYYRPKDIVRMAEGLRLAGLPE